MKPEVDEYIKWLEKQLKDCQPFAPAIPFITIAIQKAKLLLESFDVGNVECDLCEYNWVACRPPDVLKLECPNCGNMSNYKRLFEK